MVAVSSSTCTEQCGGLGCHRCSRFVPGLATCLEGVATFVAVRVGR